MSGSAKGNPNHTPSAPARTARLPSPSIPSMLAFRNEGRAADLFPNFDTEARHGFVAEKAHHRCHNHRPQIRNRVWREKS